VTINKIYKVRVIFFLGMAVSLLAACAGGFSSVPEVTASPVTVTTTIDPSEPTSIPTPVPIASTTPTLTATSDPTQQVWYVTAIAVQATQKAVRQQSRNDKETEIAQFPFICDDMEFHSSDVSPDGKWFAASCGYKRDQTLIVQNKKGTKWILEFKDFLHPDSFFDGTSPMGALYPKFWSLDGEYLYFTTGLGYSGGGNDCFPRFFTGDYGLFRLNLKTGLWVTLIPPTDSFPGYGIEFSPTGRRYATDINGVIITDLNTGEITKIDVRGIIQGVSWSPDGIHLAYSVASCGEQSVQSSSVYVWDALTNQTQMLITTDGMLLRPELWGDNSTLRVIGEKVIDLDVLYTTYIYDIAQNNLMFTGTTTPSP